MNYNRYVVGFYTKLGYSKCLEPSGLYCKYLPLFANLPPGIVNEYALHLEHEMEREDEHEYFKRKISLFLGQLNPEEVEMYHRKQERDDTVAITVLIYMKWY